MLSNPPVSLSTIEGIYGSYPGTWRSKGNEIVFLKITYQVEDADVVLLDQYSDQANSYIVSLRQSKNLGCGLEI